MADWVSISLQGLLAKLADTKTSLSHIRTSYPSNLMETIKVSKHEYAFIQNYVTLLKSKTLKRRQYKPCC